MRLTAIAIALVTIAAASTAQAGHEHRIRAEAVRLRNEARVMKNYVFSQCRHEPALHQLSSEAAVLCDNANRLWEQSRCQTSPAAMRATLSVVTSFRERLHCKVRALQAAGGGHRLAHVCRLLDRIERTETELCGLLSVPVVAPAPIHARPVYAPRPTHLPQLIQAPQHVVRRHVYNPPIYSHRPHYEYGRPTLQIGNQCFSLRIGF